ncbi:MAG: hypothetical protein LBT04_02390 [Prevotellaceae bacterium]|jgi:hypothetical protein|nr:hypothetical protein [Prevotellaceae bacterium]
MRYKVFGTIFALIVVSFALVAQTHPARVPAVPYPIEYVQPNGDTLVIRLYGDESKHYSTTLDGYVIVENKEGYLCYATLDNNGNYIPSRRIANNKEKRTKCENRFLKKITKK